MNKLIRVGNNIIISCQYPTGIKNFSKSHRQISKMYEQILGQAPKLKEFDDYCDYLYSSDKFNKRMEKLIQMNLWAGANISQKIAGRLGIPAQQKLPISRKFLSFFYPCLTSPLERV